MKYLLYLLVLTIVISCTQNKTREFLPTEKKEPFQVFLIKSDRDTTLIGDKGTILKLRANSFLSNTGHEANEQVELKIKEFYTIEDFINNRLSTNTLDGRILRSSGMLFIEAKSDTSVLKLKPDHPITIMFQRVQVAKTANLFSGKTGAFGEVRWSLLEPVHNDTIIFREQILTQLSYGEERVTVYVKFIIAEDTIELTRQNGKDFENVLERWRKNEQATYQFSGLDSIPSYDIQIERNIPFVFKQQI
jgi:hypothetical protein